MVMKRRVEKLIIFFLISMVCLINTVTINAEDNKRIIEVKWLTDRDYERIDAASDGRHRVKQNDKYGYMDLDYQVVIQPQYTIATAFSYGMAIVVNEDDSFGQIANVIDIDGNIVIEGRQLIEGKLFVYESGLISEDGHILLWNAERVDVYTSQGERLFYGDKVMEFFENKVDNVLFPSYAEDTLTFNISSDKYIYAGIVTKDENIIIFDPKKYDMEEANVYEIFEGCLIVYYSNYPDELCGIVDLKGNWIIEPKYEKINGYTFNNPDYPKGAIAVSDHNKDFFVDRNLDIIIDDNTDIEYADVLEDGYLRYETITSDAMGSYWTVINPDGSVYIPPHYAPLGFMNEWQEGLLVIRTYSDNLYHTFKTDGNLAFEKGYDYMTVFENGLSFFRDEKGQYGLINREGNILIEPEYNDFTSFKEGVSFVQLGYEYYLINVLNEIIGKVNFEYDYDYYYGFLDDGTDKLHFIVEEDDLLGIVEIDIDAGLLSEEAGNVYIEIVESNIAIENQKAIEDESIKDESTEILELENQSTKKANKTNISFDKYFGWFSNLNTTTLVLVGLLLYVWGMIMWLFFRRDKKK